MEFELRINAPQDFKFSLDGAVQVLDQRSYAYVQLRPTQIKADIQINFLVWHAIMRCSAGLGTGGSVGGFDFYLRFEDNLVDEVNRIVPAALDTAFRAATALLQQAEQEVASWRSAADHLGALIEARKAEVRKGQTELLAKVHDAVASVEAAKAKVGEMRGLVDQAQREFDDHNVWYYWLCGVAEYYAAKLGVLWVAYHLAEAVLDLAILVLEVKASLHHLRHPFLSFSLSSSLV